MSVPSADKDEWLFLAAVSSFATQGIVSPSAEELCGTLGTENRETATRKSNSKKQRERLKEKEKEAAAWIDPASTKTLPNNNLCSYIMYIYPGMPV